jgi:hypothetical protein
MAHSAHFDPVGAFQGARQNALTIQGQEQGIQRETAAAPIRNQLAGIKLQEAQAGQQRGQTEFGQEQAIVKARVLNSVQRALRNLKPEERSAAVKSIIPQIDPSLGLDETVFTQDRLTDIQLDNGIAGTQALLNNPSALSAAQREFASQTRDFSPEDELKARRVATGLDARAGTITGEQRTATTPGLTEAVGTSKAQIAESVAERKVVGKDKGQAIVDLPQVLETANNSLATIDSILNHPGLEAATGLNSVINPANFIPGTDAHDFALASQQLQGQAFLVAFESLKGGGQITEPEGKKATEAIAQLSRAQSTPQYRKALRTLRDIVVRAKDRAIDKAGETTDKTDVSGLSDDDLLRF